jgi:hypothetical protein
VYNKNLLIQVRAHTKFIYSGAGALIFSFRCARTLNFIQVRVHTKSKVCDDGVSHTFFIQVRAHTKFIDFFIQVRAHTKFIDFFIQVRAHTKFIDFSFSCARTRMKKLVKE